MMHTVLYRLARGQKQALALLGMLFLLLSLVWFVLEFAGMDFPMEPLVVFVGGTATLMASYWPWKPSYRDRRLSGQASFDYGSNNHRFRVGREELSFTLQFSRASGERIHLYNDSADIEAIALAKGAGLFEDIRDASVFEFSTRVISPSESDIVVLRNTEGHYALVHVLDVKDSHRTDDRDEITFKWIINPEHGTDFS